MILPKAPGYTMTALPTFAVLLTVSKILNKLNTIFPPYKNNAKRLNAMHPTCLLHASFAKLDWTISTGNTTPRV
jgi:hypothetical protein